MMILLVIIVTLKFIVIIIVVVIIIIIIIISISTSSVPPSGILGKSPKCIFCCFLAFQLELPSSIILPACAFKTFTILQDAA